MMFVCAVTREQSPRRQEWPHLRFAEYTRQWSTTVREIQREPSGLVTAAVLEARSGGPVHAWPWQYENRENFPVHWSSSSAKGPLVFLPQVGAMDFF